MNSFKNALLVSSVLTTIGFSASATTFIETTDFPGTTPGTSIDFSMFQSVQGTLQGAGKDQADFFTFTGLTADDNFSITFATCPRGVSATCPEAIASFTFTADGFSETLASGDSKTDDGVLAATATTLTVGVTIPTTGTGVSNVAEGYTVTLSELPAGVPEPSAAAIFAIGLAGLAGARRKRYRYH